jgi:hypothetical protein
MKHLGKYNRQHWSVDLLNKALFGYMYIHFNPNVLEWIGMELILITLQSTSTHVDWDKYMCIKQGLSGAGQLVSWTSNILSYQPILCITDSEPHC